jgi:hypothetical protein
VPKLPRTRVIGFPVVRVAAVQGTPVVLDAEGCVEKAVGLLREAADRGVELAVLPETFVPLYPSNAWAKTAAGFDGWDVFWERLWANRSMCLVRWLTDWSRAVVSAICTA